MSFLEAIVVFTLFLLMIFMNEILSLFILINVDFYAFAKTGGVNI